MISETDVTLVDAEIIGAASAVVEVVGLEARVTLYAGRPIRAADLGPPALVDRNQIVSACLFHRQPWPS